MSTQVNITSLLNGMPLSVGVSVPITHPFSQKEDVSFTQLDSFSSFNSIVLPQKQSREEIVHIIQLLIPWMHTQKNELALIASKETGSPIRYHLDDLNGIIKFIEHVPEYCAPQLPDMRSEPKGRVGIFLSANEPIILGLLPVLGALLAGNQVFVKPSSKTPTLPYLFTKTLLKLGIDPSLLHLILPTREITQKLLESGFFNTVMSFGNYQTNCLLASYCSLSGTEFIPENEGNDWIYVDENSEYSLKDLTSLLVHSFTKHNGQMCDAIRGILVKKSLFDSLVESLSTSLKTIVTGDPGEKDTQVGAVLAGSAQTIVREVNTSHSQCDSVINFHHQDSVITPTLLINPQEGTPVVSQGIFGPVAWMTSCNSVDDVIEYYHKYNPYGLGFSVLSQNTQVIQRLIEEVPVSRVNINTDPVDVSIFSPWGGVKKSGVSGPYSWIERFSNRKLVNYGNY